jgi:hypothetical protein
VIFKDSSSENSAMRNGNDGNVMNENATFPLGTSGDGFDADSALDPLAGAESVKRSNAGTLLIIAVIVIAAGGLFSMRFLAKVNASATSDGDLEKSIVSFLGTLDGGPGTNKSQSVLLQNDTTVLNVLKESYTEHQVPWENIAKDPFDLSGENTPVPTTTPDDGSHQWDQQRREALQAMESASKSLELSSVLMGSTPLANINGKILRVGDVLHMDKQNVDFRITKIESDSATLVGEDAALNVKYEITIAIKRD